MADMAKGYSKIMKNIKNIQNLHIINTVEEIKEDPEMWNTADIMRELHVGRNKALLIKRKVLETYPCFYQHARYVYAVDVRKALRILVA